jgi:hypothetical protein
MGSFETSDNHASLDLRPIRVPTRKEDIYGAAREMVEDLSGWEVIESNDEALKLTCRRKGGLLGGTSTIEISVQGPDGIPSATVNVKSTTEGGLLSRDKANVNDFIKPFNRRVC